jgi:hypothetical protein
MMTKLSGFSAFLFSTALSAAAFGADDPAQRFIDRLSGAETFSTVASARVAGDGASNPAKSFLDRLAGIQTPASEPTGTAVSGDPARAFIDRLAGVPAAAARVDTQFAQTGDSPRPASVLAR